MSISRKIRFASAISTIALAFGGIVVSAPGAEAVVLCNTPFAGGDGTSAAPFQVSTMAHLEAVGVCGGAGKYFTQMNDIALTNAYLPATLFTGIYDGANHNITGLAITASTNKQGVFKEVRGNEISRDTQVKNLSIFGQINSGAFDSAGGLAGRLYGATVENVNSTVAITGSGSNLGSLLGESSFSTVRNSTAAGDVIFAGGGDNNTWGSGGLIGGAFDSTIIEHSSATGSVLNAGCASGGLVGGFIVSQISDSFASGNVTMACPVDGAGGGLVGYLGNSTIDRSFATGNVSGPGRNGGLVGDVEDTSAVDAFVVHVRDSYATGSVNGDVKVGSLIGALCGGEVSTSYGAGAIVVSVSNGGSAIGAHDIAWEADCPSFTETVANVFWNSTTLNSAATSDFIGATGKTTSELKTLATFTSPWSIATLWQADKVWAICPTLNSGYPVLTSLTLQASCVLPVVAVKPVNTVKPTIAGSKKKVGAKLTAVKGNWTSAATPTIAYQWYRCTKPLSAAATTIRANLKCSAIARATAASYKLAKTDKKKYIVLKVTATNATGSTVYYSKASTKIS